MFVFKWLMSIIKLVRNSHQVFVFSLAEVQSVACSKWWWAVWPSWEKKTSAHFGNNMNYSFFLLLLLQFSTTNAFEHSTNIYCVYHNLMILPNFSTESSFRRHTFAGKLPCDRVAVLVIRYLVAFVADTWWAFLVRSACRPNHVDHNDVRHKIYIHIYLVELRFVFSAMYWGE